MARIHTLPDGEHVRLRVARARDKESLRALLERCGPHHDGVDAARLARFDPRHRIVICATALVDSVQAVVGAGAVELDGGEPPEVFVEERHDGELADILRGALDGRVRARRRR